MRRFTMVAAVVLLGMLAGQAGSASAGTSGTQRWLALTRPGEPTKVVATGTLVASGTVQDFTTLDFPTGTFDNIAIQHYPDGDLYYHGHGTFTLTVDPRTCIGDADVVGPFVITGGTGAYAGATGEGVALSSLRFFFDKTPAGCAQVPSRTYGVAKATGTLNLP